MAGPGPREEYLQDDTYFMSVAVLTAKRSRDPNTQVGACIAKDGKVISVGYNHMPIGDDKHDWSKMSKSSDHKYLYVCYAVTHAILNAKGVDLKGATVYTTLFPHCKCAVNIIVTGVQKVIYLHDKYPDKPWCEASKKMLNQKDIPYEKIKALEVDISEPATDPYEG